MQCLQLRYKIVAERWSRHGPPFATIKADQPPGGGEEIRLLTPLEGPDACAATGDSLYGWETSAAGQGLLTYIDFASKTKVALCSQPGCLHDGPHCTAWAESGSGKLFAAPDGGIYGISPVYLEAAQTSCQALWRMEPDGSERRTVLTLGAGEYFCDAIAGSEEALYLTVSSFAGQKTLVRFCPAAQTAEPLFLLAPAQWLYGAFGDKLVLLLCQTTGEETAEFCYTLYDTATASVEEVLRYPHTDGEYAANLVTRTQADRIYLLRPTGGGQAALSFLSLQTGEETVVSQSLPCPESAQPAFVDILDDHLRISLTLPAAPEQSEVYLVDLRDGTAVRQALSLQRYGVSLPLPVLAQPPGQYLVVAAWRTLPMALTGQDGTTWLSEREVPVYALIRREDFAAGRPVYDEVEDLTLS